MSGLSIRPPWTPTTIRKPWRAFFAIAKPILDGDVVLVTAAELSAKA